MRNKITLFIVLLILIFILFGCKDKNFSSEKASSKDYPACIMVDNVLYYDTNEIIKESKIGSSDIARYTSSYTDEIPKKNAETNFSRKRVLYAKYKRGVVVQNEDGKWMLFERQKCFSE